MWGKRSHEKGSDFQDKVAELYRLLGAQVTENVDVCGKKVDLLAVFSVPGGASLHRTIVECKAERTNRAQNQRVMEFKGLLETARASGCADSAEIVSLQPWSEQAKGFARQSGVSLVTYAEKLRRLIDFGPYLRKLTDAVNVSSGNDVRPLAQRYVSLGGRVDDGQIVPDLLAHLAHWANDTKASHPCVVLGEYGSGKTSLCRMLAAKLAEQCIKEIDRSRIPILLQSRRVHEDDALGDVGVVIPR